MIKQMTIRHFRYEAITQQSNSMLHAYISILSFSRDRSDSMFRFDSLFHFGLLIFECLGFISDAWFRSRFLISFSAHYFTNSKWQQVGKKVILPASFTGGPRDQSRRYHDAMAIVRRLGKPSLFITMTCNPHWDEIMLCMLGMLPADRPDIVARVFNLKLAQLLEELKKDGIFGRCVASMHVIEFQHRGLPHAHILLVLDNDFKQPHEVDAFVTAELPVEPKEPKGLPRNASRARKEAFRKEHTEYEEKMKRWKTLNDLVLKHMIHGPCGHENPNSPCMQDGPCGKKFPKDFIRETYLGDSNHIYPTYRRRSPADGGAQVKHLASFMIEPLILFVIETDLTPCFVSTHCFFFLVRLLDRFDSLFCFNFVMLR